MLDTELIFGLITFFLGITTVFLYWFSTRNFDFWKKRNVPFVKPYPFVGSVMQNMTQPLHEVELSRYREKGRIYGHFEGNRPLLSVAEPALLREILVKDFHCFTGRRPLATGDRVVDSMMIFVKGEDWKRIRTVVSPTFTMGKIRRMMGIFKDCARTLIKNFKTAAEKGTPVEVKSIYSAFVMDIIVSSAFSTKLDSFNDPGNEFVLTANKAFKQNSGWRYALMLSAPWLMKWSHISIFKPEITEFFQDVTLRIIEERRKTSQRRNDFLQLLMDVAKETLENPESEKENEDMTSNYGEDDTNHQIFKTVSKKNLSNNEIVAQCVMFFVAGYETVVSTLAFSTYLLALNQDVQEKVFAEIAEVLKASNGEMTYEAIQGMKYLDNIVFETLRIYSPGIRLERVADVDYELGDTGITIPKGMTITVPIHAMHMDPEFFSDPEKFDPDRFTPEETVNRDQYTYFPFGAGPRNCVGMRFALMEIKVCLAHVIANFKINRCPKTKVPLEFLASQGPMRTKDMTVSLEPQKKNPLIK